MAAEATTFVFFHGVTFLKSIDIFGNKVKMRLFEKTLHCNGCGNKVVVVVINDKGSRKYQVTNEKDKRHVSIIRRNKDEEEVIELRALRESITQ